MFSGGTSNIFGGGQQGGQNNLFGKPATTGQGMFGGTGQQQGGLFGGGQQQQQGNNLFGGQNQQQGTNNLFGGQQQGQQQGGSIFGGGGQGQQNQGGNGLFGGQNQQQQSGNLFGGQGQQQQGSIFGGQGQGQQQGGLFGGQNQQNQGGLFGGGGNGQGQNNLFGQQNQGQQNLFGLSAPLVGAGQPFGQNPNLMAFSADDQQNFLKLVNPDFLRSLINQCRSQLDPRSLDSLQLSANNQFKNQKVSKFVQTFNCKQPFIQIKKHVRQNVIDPVKKLKEKDAQLQKMSIELGEKVFDKLQKYRQALIKSLENNGMLQAVKKQVQTLEQQINSFVRPVCNDYFSRKNYSFPDPDKFCIDVSSKLLDNMTALDKKMDELLSCQEYNQEVMDTAQVIQNLINYYYQVAANLRDFAQRYNKIKRAVVQRTRVGNPQEALRRLNDKANTALNKEMQAYNLVRQIQNLLKKRQRRISEGKSF